MADSEGDSSVAGDAARVSQLTPCIQKAFGDSKFADLRVECGSRVWHAHRIIICGQAPFFDKACSSGFEESKSKVVKLKDDDPVVVHEMLRFLYTEDYLDDTDESENGAVPGALVMNVLMHTIADKYDIPGLRQLANAKFAARAAWEWNTGAFASAIEEMYTTDTAKEEMHKAAVEIAAEHADDLFFKDCGARYRKVTESVPKFGTELAVRIFKGKANKEGESRYRCPRSTCKKECVFESVDPDSSTYCWCPYCGGGYLMSSWFQTIVKAED